MGRDEASGEVLALSPVRRDSPGAEGSGIELYTPRAGENYDKNPAAWDPLRGQAGGDRPARKSRRAGQQKDTKNDQQEDTKNDQQNKENDETGEQDIDYGVAFYGDSDWAGDRVTRRSVSGGAILFHGALVASWSRRQATIALCSAEAELTALTTGLAETTFVANLAGELGENFGVPTVYADSSAALAIAQKSGTTPRVRHLSIKALFSQEYFSRGAANIKKVAGTRNPADTFTKPQASEGAHRAHTSMGFYTVGAKDADDFKDLGKERREEAARRRQAISTTSLAGMYTGGGSKNKIVGAISAMIVPGSTGVVPFVYPSEKTWPESGGDAWPRTASNGSAQARVFARTVGARSIARTAPAR